jgi:glucokinase
LGQYYVTTMGNKALAFDVGGTKTAWAVIDDSGKMGKQGTFPTPTNPTIFLKEIAEVITKNPTETVGMGVAGTISADHKDTIVCTNMPSLSHLELSKHLKEVSGSIVMLDNDARCALIGEVWKGAAQETSSAVMITLGTGVGGAVMQKYIVLPHPQDITLEIGHIVADPSDLFPASAGRGTVEALLGGKNLEERFGEPLSDLAKKVRTGDADAVEVWSIISYYFTQSIRAIFDTYSCRMIIVGGRGVHDLQYYQSEEKLPCPVVPAVLGENAGLYGAARIALDAHEDTVEAEAKDWDE